jgi:TonB family protein
VRTGRVAKKVEVPFSLTILAALSLHLLAGVALRYYPIGFAAPARAVSPEPPVTMRFVEVPPNSPVVAERPSTRNLSDANHRADPFRSKSPSPAKPGPGNSAGPVFKPNRTTSQAASSPEPAAPAPEPPMPEKSKSIGDVSENPKSLNASLQNLDKYIAEGSTRGGAGGTGEGEGEGGDIMGKPGGSGVLFDTEGHDLGPWGNKVVEIVRSNWIIPVAAELGTRGISGISFQVDRAGNISNLNIVSASGVVSFDQAALNALKSSHPLPPLPPEYPRPILNAVFRFYYNTPVPQN